jgi:diguanylate cyclase (GGDEF)-like protein
VGDDFLRQLAKILAEHARRAGDVVARLGGQQFVFLMGGGLSPALTTALAERIRSAVEALRVPHPEAKPNGNVTVSVGTASMVPSRDENHHRLVAAANTALAEAKRLGRNRVVEFSADQS